MAVPYKSIGQAFTDSMSGQIQVIFPGLAAAMPHVKSGAFKPLAVTADKRQAVLPNVPTIKELGYEGFEGLTWYGVMGPKNLPPAIVKRLNEEINKILASPDLRETFAVQALNVMPMTPPQFGKYVADEIAHWTAVAKASKIEADCAAAPLISISTATQPRRHFAIDFIDEFLVLANYPGIGHG